MQAKRLLPILIAALGLLIFPFWQPSPAHAATTQIPSLAEFIRQVKASDSLAGIYSEGVFALPIVQQPSGNPAFVSNQPGVVTNFSLAQQYHTTGLLAHNTLAGAEFSHLSVGQILTLVYANGEQQTYRVTQIQRFQALSPHNTRSDFLNLANPTLRLTATELFNQVYAPGNRLVLQTCISNQGNPSWGRMFIVAVPVARAPLPVINYDPMPSWYTGGGYAAR